MCTYGTVHSQAGVIMLKSVNVGRNHFEIYNSFAAYFKWESVSCYDVIMMPWADQIMRLFTVCFLHFLYKHVLHCQHKYCASPCVLINYFLQNSLYFCSWKFLWLRFIFLTYGQLFRYVSNRSGAWGRMHFLTQTPVVVPP